MSRRGIQSFLLYAGFMLILLACQSNASSDIKETETQDQESEADPESVKVAYQLQQEFPLTMQVTSTSIKHTGFLKKDFTCEGENRSPQLAFTNIPSAAQSLVILVEDIDATEGSFAHWLVWGLQPDVKELVDGFSGSSDLPEGVIEGTNGFASIGWKGPCPPPRVLGTGIAGSMNRAQTKNTGVTSSVYLLHVYAINTEISIGPDATREDLLEVIDGHIIAGGFLSTKFLSSIVIRKAI